MYKTTPIINPTTTPIEEALPLYSSFALGIISSQIIYSMVPPAKARQRAII